MDRWKRAGRVGRSDDDALWAQFRKAADEFFNARQADRDQISTSEKENLAKKEELLKKAEALVPVADEAAAKKARQALGAIQDEWDQIGYVPRDDMRRIEGRLDAVDKQIKAVEDAAWKKTDPEADARKSSFEEQLTAQLAELDEKIAAESGGGEGHQGAVAQRYQVGRFAVRPGVSAGRRRQDGRPTHRLPAVIVSLAWASGNSPRRSFLYYDTADATTVVRFDAIEAHGHTASKCRPRPRCAACRRYGAVCHDTGQVPYVWRPPSHFYRPDESRNCTG